MPKGIDWIYFTFVNLAFILQIVAMYYFTTIAEIKKDWPKYRCNPMFMPLSDNIEQDFVYCIQNMQMSFMGYLLQPLSYITSNLSTMGSEFTTNINGLRTMLSNIRTFITSIVQSVFGVFLNLITEFQKITISIKDLIGKLVGIMVSMMYIMDGSIKTMKSTWNGPPGQLVQGLGHCFLPETILKLKNGKCILMKDVNLGDVLENGSKVVATMKIDNNNETIYTFEESGVYDSNIYVTGSHLVYESSKFIQVKDHPKAMKTNQDCEYFTCLITDDHKIQIGQMTFWDWEDHFMK
jgi:hypothetical protein